MKLLLLNYSYLQHELREIGHEVTSAGMMPDCDIVCSMENYDVEWILQQIDFTPDWIIFMDSIERVLPTGLETIEIPLAACFIDSTLNRFWQHPLAEVCSLVLTDQTTDASYLKQKGLNAHWFPLAADSLIYQPSDIKKEYDLSFIGHRHAENRIKRENILKGLAGRFNVTLFTGEPHLSAEGCAHVYQRSKLVLNENLFPAVNLRLFEAMACGTTVLTEANAPGLSNLFKHERELLAYTPDNLIDLVAHYLDDDSEREKIAERSAVAIGRDHTLLKRAKQLTDLISRTEPIQVSRPKRCVIVAESFMNYGLKWSHKDLGRAHVVARMLLDVSGSRDLTDKGMELRRLGLEGLLSVLGGNLESATSYFQAARDLAPDSGSALDLLSITKIALLDTTDEERRLTSMDFHLERGEMLLKSGLAFQPGLMARNLPVHFWSALEHFMFTAQMEPQVWELVGDLLMKAEAPDQAAKAYREAETVNQDKVQEADKLAYALL
ncbi:glycosyltransferase [Calditrichota bacterium]